MIPEAQKQQMAEAVAKIRETMAAAAKAAGAVTVGLGPRILRCETAPLAALTAAMLLTGNLE